MASGEGCFGRLPCQATNERSTSAMMPAMSGKRSSHPVHDLLFDTLAVHAGAEPDEATGAVSPPIYQTSTYRQVAVGEPTDGYEYARTQNPTRERLERAVAAL